MGFGPGTCIPEVHARVGVLGHQHGFALVDVRSAHQGVIEAVPGRDQSITDLNEAAFDLNK